MRRFAELLERLAFTPSRNADPIKVRGKVVRITDEGIGVKFVRPAARKDR